MGEPVDFAMRSPELAKLECEYTAPGAETEAVDCWEVATYRRVNKDDVTVGVFCGDHRRGDDEKIGD